MRDKFIHLLHRLQILAKDQSLSRSRPNKCSHSDAVSRIMRNEAENDTTAMQFLHLPNAERKELIRKLNMN